MRQSRTQSRMPIKHQTQRTTHQPHASAPPRPPAPLHPVRLPPCGRDARLVRWSNPAIQNVYPTTYRPPRIRYPQASIPTFSLLKVFVVVSRWCRLSRHVLHLPRYRPVLKVRIRVHRVSVVVSSAIVVGSSLSVPDDCYEKRAMCQALPRAPASYCVVQQASSSSSLWTRVTCFTSHILVHRHLPISSSQVADRRCWHLWRWTDAALKDRFSRLSWAESGPMGWCDFSHVFSGL